MSLLTLDEAMGMRAGLRLVFTNGVFDILHAGHVRNLTQARAMGDLLFVGCNSDDSVRRLGKAPDRPIHTLQDRATVLAGLRVVDGVIAFDELTPERLVSILKPEVHVKGGDYSLETMPEAKIVLGYGGEVVILPLSDGFSTSEILRKLATE